MIGGSISVALSLMHLGCIVVGPSCYQFLGAGEQMAVLAENGHWYPPVVTSVIACILFVWALFAFSGAGAIRHLPLVRWVLLAITLVFVFRGIAFPILGPLFPGNSSTFWIVTSSISLLIGIIHSAGLMQVWRRLS